VYFCDFSEGEAVFVPATSSLQTVDKSYLKEKFFILRYPDVHNKIIAWCKENA
jgi:hypothetical protein